ncbi:hypothetical protein LTR37_007777 [Vermiconidia calcicola]|uniref:Uncharacterized protein n=1 Tax=Vermiconidia calcicola TaxID=1690605 RepID=A0ACC3NE43_9PEZI|nr:hypothetical protein LTR37_007777 [Vermiconidia calcicola]
MLDEDREKVRQRFLTLRPEEQILGWEEMWQRHITPWNRNQPNPALTDALKEKTYLVESPFKDTGGGRVRKKVLVPGCGRGHDVLLFASYGYDAYGLDASSTAIEAARGLLSEQGKNQRYPVRNIQSGRGEVKFVSANFFENDFLSLTHTTKSERTFDLIYDYTFLCALEPSMRPQWAARMGELLSSTGRLICMEFPLGKDPKLGGPPHGLGHELYEQLFAKPGVEVNYNLSGHVCEDRSGDKTDAALVRIETWTPERTFEGQEKQTMVSVWRHWK